MDKQPSLFRKKSLDRITEPERLTDYLRVSKPMSMLVPIALFIAVIGAAVWGFTGTIELSADGNALVSEGPATIILTDNSRYYLDEGMRFSIMDNEYVIQSTDFNEFEQRVGYAEVAEYDGTYPVSITVRKAHPFELIFEV